LNKSAKESRPDQIFLLGAQMFLLGDEAARPPPILRDDEA
jgi:hypothetical protein